MNAIAQNARTVSEVKPVFGGKAFPERGMTPLVRKSAAPNEAEVSDPAPNAGTFEVVRREDGSIDTAHYALKAQAQRRIRISGSVFDLGARFFDLLASFKRPVVR